MIAYNRLSLQMVRESIEKQDCKYLGGDYTGNKSKLLIRFKCGHEGWSRYDVFRNSKTFLCFSCSKRAGADKLKRNPDRIQKDLKKAKLNFIGFVGDYKSSDSVMQYECSFGHIVTSQIATFYKNKRCSLCAIEKQYNSRRGSGHPLWNGGTSALSPLVKGNMIEWRESSIALSKGKCVVTGGYYNAVHHIYGFNMILDEALENLNFDKNRFSFNYTEEEILSIITECKKLHLKYPLGVCLRKDVHMLFHKKYGYKDNTPKQFQDFLKKIKSGKIIIPN